MYTLAVKSKKATNTRASAYWVGNRNTPVTQAAGCCIQRLVKLKDPIKKIEDILDFLTAKKKEETEVSIKDQLRIQTFIKNVSRSRNRYQLVQYRQLLYDVQYEAGGVIHNELFESTKKKKKQSKKRKRNQEEVPMVSIFSDEESEDSDSDLEIMVKYKKYPELFQQAVDHSDANQIKNVINPRNTNMLTFLDRSLIPYSINGKPNFNATPKSKQKVAVHLKKKEIREQLRSYQEQLYFGSHLNQGGKGKFNKSIDLLKSSLRKDSLSAKHVKPLVISSRRGFTIRNTEGHAEQTLLRSKIWDALKKRLVARIKDAISKKDLKKIQGGSNTILVTLLLNRSSCRGCGLALSLALIEFWQELALALGEKLTWKDMKKKYSSMVRFLIRFPTVYEYDKENKNAFVNLEEVLKSIASSGWEIEPIRPDIKGGLKSYKQLNTSLNKLGLTRSETDLRFYHSGGSYSRKKPKKNKDTPESIRWNAFTALLDNVKRVQHQPLTNVGTQPEEHNFSNQFIGHSSSKKSKSKKGFSSSAFKILGNSGGGDCLFHALSGRNLKPNEILTLRSNISAIRQNLQDTQISGNRNAHALTSALSQTPWIGPDRTNQMMQGRDSIPNAVYAALQNVPGIYAGEDELIQWLQLQYTNGRNLTVAVVYDTGTLATFTRNGRQLVNNPSTNLQQTIDNADITLYKTPGHWEKILSLKKKKQ